MQVATLEGIILGIKHYAVSQVCLAEQCVNLEDQGVNSSTL
jgi:hypothetical protein